MGPFVSGSHSGQFWKFIRVVARASFLLMAVYYSTMWMDHIVFHLLVMGTWGVSPFGCCE